MTDQDILAEIRTLLAVERNYLAIERTHLAQLRTGIAVSFTGPPIAGAVGFLFELANAPAFLDYFVYVFLGILTLWGVLMSYRAYFGLRKVRKVLKEVVKGEVEASKKSENVEKLMEKFLSHDFQ